MSIRTVRQALEVGINWFDTAPTYGLGHSEQVLGKALGHVRNNVVIATKFGRTWDSDGHLGRCGRYDWIIQECEASLQRLGTDYIDLHQMHWPDTETGVPVEESMRAASDLLAAGKVRFIGVCNFDVALLKRAISACPVVSIQPSYNLLDRVAEAELIPFSRDHGLGVVAYSPLASGLLSGSLNEGTRFAPDDWRAADPDFTGDRFKEKLARVADLHRIAAEAGLGVAELAVAWVLRDEAVTAAIVGARRPTHIKELATAADRELAADLLTSIDGACPPGAVS
jgi:aryl-alcohol dehydrogenase-like predicted oxidoreductase